MTNILFLSLSFLTLLCLLLGWLCYRFFIDMQDSRRREARRHKEWMDEKREMDRVLSSVLRVLSSNLGGISKRISESTQIAEAIQSNAPELFRQCDGLAYWLHANHQFLVSLYAVAEEGLDSWHQRRFHEMKETGRQEIFGRIYEGAGMSAPLSEQIPADS